MPREADEERTPLSVAAARSTVARFCCALSLFGVSLLLLGDRVGAVLRHGGESGRRECGVSFSSLGGRSRSRRETPWAVDQLLVFTPVGVGAEPQI